MLRAWPVAAIREAEEIRLAEVPEGALMQRAAAGLAAVCAGELRRRAAGVSGRRVVLLVGAGNNGGDALYAGERLARRGARVDAVLLAPRERVHAAGLAALLAAGGRVRSVATVPAAAHLVVDGIVGLGGVAGLRPDAAAAVASIPVGATVVAVDLPSGVDPDTGELPEPGPGPDGTSRRRHVVADVTVTFGAPKPCLLLPPADRVAGRIHLVDIGLAALLTSPPAVERLEPEDAAALRPPPGPADHKYTRGVLGVVAGSDTYPGAAVLVVGGAARAGIGMVRYLGPPAAGRAVLAAHPETVAAPGRVQAWVVGSGYDPDQADAARAALGSGLPVAVDAGALDLLPPHCGPGVLLTPHAGELAALLTARGGATERAAVEARPLVHARRAAALTGATVLLKGATTLVVEPDGATAGRVRSQAEAPARLATAGAGDVLAGLAGSLLAAGLDPLDAGSVAAHVHGRAAHRAAHRAGGPVTGPGGPITASDVVAAVAGVLADLAALARPG